MSKQVRFGEKQVVKCLKCRQWTTHTIRGAFDKYECDDDQLWENLAHDLLECDGCHAGVYRTTYTNCEMSETDYQAEHEYFPPRPSMTSDCTPKEFDRFKAKHYLWSAYLQTIAVTNAELPTMAAAGIRLLVEGVCKELTPDQPSVKKKKPILFQRIEMLFTEGFVAKKQMEALHHIRESGNDSVHEAALPSMEEIRSALAVVEHLLAQAFDQRYHTQVLAKAREAAERSKQEIAMAAGELNVQAPATENSVSQAEAVRREVAE